MINQLNLSKKLYLKIMRVNKKTGSCPKADKSKEKYNETYQKNIKEIEDNTCNPLI